MVVAPEESSRDFIGHSSYGALALAVEYGAALYADDLGLRRMGNADAVPSFASPSLLIAWMQVGRIESDDANGRLRRLIAMRHTRIPLSFELLKGLASSMTGSERHEAIGVNLAPPFFSPQSSARLGARLLKWAATDAIVPQSLRDLTETLLVAMACHWPKPVCAHALLRAVLDEMSLLPAQYSTVKTVCIAFAKTDPSFRFRR
jgi:hypothetical protein